MNSCLKKQSSKKISLKTIVITVNKFINCPQSAYRNFRSAFASNQKLSYSDDGKSNLFQYYNLAITNH